MASAAGSAWRGAVAALGGDAEAAAGAAVELGTRYAEPHRRYHTDAHVAAVLRDVGWLGPAAGLDPTTQATVVLAACAHDVVYDARPGDDERASAAWARTWLAAAAVPTPVVERVAGLVLATLTHTAEPGDPAAAVLLDADLAVLAGPEADYADYVTRVRAEYAAVSDADWRRGRGAVLAGLLDRDRLYLTESGAHRWEAAARRNVGTELALLRADRAGPSEPGSG
jgi:predicted metal-dependent HD superfamily phosphohydrolase